MSHKLIITSAPQGLAANTSGFCVVGKDDAMPLNLERELEGLSGYRWLFDAGDPSNPVAYVHYKLRIANKLFHALTRISDAGADYTGRSNKLASHLALTASEVTPGGPAWLLGQRSVFPAAWDGNLDGKLATAFPASGSDQPTCDFWAQTTGDAGWGGVLAQAVADRQKQPVWVIYEPGFDLLRLLRESMSILPDALRWNVTFNTYFSKLPPSLECQWRGAVAGSDAAVQAQRATHVIDLTAGARPLTGEYVGEFIDAARDGRLGTISQPEQASGAQRIQRRDEKPVDKRQTPKEISLEPLPNPENVMGQADKLPKPDSTSTPPPRPSPGGKKPIRKMNPRERAFTKPQTKSKKKGNDWQQTLVFSLGLISGCCLTLLVMWLLGVLSPPGESGEKSPIPEVATNETQRAGEDAQKKEALDAPSNDVGTEKSKKTKKKADKTSTPQTVDDSANSRVKEDNKRKGEGDSKTTTPKQDREEKGTADKNSAVTSKENTSQNAATINDKDESSPDPSSDPPPHDDTLKRPGNVDELATTEPRENNDSSDEGEKSPPEPETFEQAFLQKLQESIRLKRGEEQGLDEGKLAEFAYFNIGKQEDGEERYEIEWEGDWRNGKPYLPEKVSKFLHETALQINFAEGVTARSSLKQWIKTVRPRMKKSTIEWHFNDFCKLSWTDLPESDAKDSKSNRFGGILTVKWLNPHEKEKRILMTRVLKLEFENGEDNCEPLFVALANPANPLIEAGEEDENNRGSLTRDDYIRTVPVNKILSHFFEKKPDKPYEDELGLKDIRISFTKSNFPEPFQADIHTDGELLYFDADSFWPDRMENGEEEYDRIPEDKKKNVAIINSEDEEPAEMYLQINAQSNVRYKYHPPYPDPPFKDLQPPKPENEEPQPPEIVADLLINVEIDRRGEGSLSLGWKQLDLHLRRPEHQFDDFFDMNERQKSGKEQKWRSARYFQHLDSFMDFKIQRKEYKGKTNQQVVIELEQEWHRFNTILKKIKEKQKTPNYEQRATIQKYREKINNQCDVKEIDTDGRLFAKYLQWFVDKDGFLQWTSPHLKKHERFIPPSHRESKNDYWKDTRDSRKQIDRWSIRAAYGFKKGKRWHGMDRRLREYHLAMKALFEQIKELEQSANPIRFVLFYDRPFNDGKTIRIYIPKMP